MALDAGLGTLQTTRKRRA